ncbi:MAG TPA: hypothetical protein DEA08_21625, partial [Planctomycetes bacterium]|nr:hypothetical protein [Planctomycetota bacterium]
MNEREMMRTLGYVGVTFLLVLITALDPFGTSAPPPELAAGGRFFPEFDDLGQATTLEVFDWDEATNAFKPFKVELREGVWRIPSKQNYPADAKEKIGKVASALMNLEKTQLRSTREEDHELLGVVNPLAEASEKPLEGRGRRVRMSDASGKVLADVVLGKEVEGGESGFRYVRRMTADKQGESEVYATKLDLELSTKFEDWIHTDLLELDVAQITSVTVDRSRLRVVQTPRGLAGEILPGEVSVIGQKDNAWLVEGMAADREADMGVIDGMTEILKELKIKDVYKREVASMLEVGFYPPQRGGGTFYSDQGEIGVALKNGVRYVLRFGSTAPSESGEVRRFMIVEASVNDAVAKDLDEAGKKKAAERAEQLQRRFQDWYYLISASDFDKLRPKHDTLTKVKEAEEEDEPGHDHDGHDHGSEGGAPELGGPKDPLAGEDAFPPVPGFDSEQPKQAEPPVEEPKKTEPPVEEPKKTEPPVEEPKKAEPPVEEPKKTEPPVEEPKAEEP